MNPSSYKKDFLFDIGNVLVKVDFDSALQQLIPKNSADAARRIDRVLERKDLFETGKLTPEKYFPWAMEALGFNGSLKDFLGVWNSIFSPNPVMWESIRKIHAAGHRLILFSNINDAHITYLLESYPVFELFHERIFSYQFGYIKPDPAIYAYAMETYGLEPSNTIYVDDLPENIQSGIKAGFHSHAYDYRDHQAFTSWLATHTEIT